MHELSSKYDMRLRVWNITPKIVGKKSFSFIADKIQLYVFSQRWIANERLTEKLFVRLWMKLDGNLLHLSVRQFHETYGRVLGKRPYPRCTSRTWERIRCAQRLHCQLVQHNNPRAALGEGSASLDMKVRELLWNFDSLQEKLNVSQLSHMSCELGQLLYG